MIDRTTIIRGPCKLTYDGATFYTREGVTINILRNTSPVPVDGFGNVDSYFQGLAVTVEFTPHGSLYQSVLDVLFAGLNLIPGASLFGATDKPLVITSASETVTVVNAAITRMPGLSMQSGRPPIGAMQFTGMVAKNGAPDELASYITSGSGADIGSAIARESMYSGTYSAQWDPASVEAWPAEFYSEGGFEVSVTLGLSPVVVDGLGAVDMTVTGVEAQVRCVPIGVSPALLRAASAPMMPGVSAFYAQPDNGPFGPLVIQTAATAPHYFSLNAGKATVASTALRWKTDQNRAGQVQFNLLRPYDAEATPEIAPLFTLTGASDPT